MENQPTQVPPITSSRSPSAAGQPRPEPTSTTGPGTPNWPAVPPAPAPVKPAIAAPVSAPPARTAATTSAGAAVHPDPDAGTAAPLGTGTAAPLGTGTAAPLGTGTAAPLGTRTRVELAASKPGPLAGGETGGDPRATLTSPEPAGGPAPVGAPAAVGGPVPAGASPAGFSADAAQHVPQPRRAATRPVEAGESPLAELQHVVRRQQAIPRTPGEDLVWQPRFAYTSALVILLALTVVSLPLWLVLYRIGAGAAGAGASPRVADLVALCMMLLGGFLTGAAAWVIIIEMRGRVRMVDTLARTGEREVMIAPAAPELPVLDAPIDRLLVAEPIGPVRAAPAGGVRSDRAQLAEAHQVSAAATLEASSKLLSAFSSVLKSFGQLAAQVAMLAVALALFIGATVLSLS